MKIQGRFSNFHTHSTFCDGKNSVEEMCIAAYEGGLTALGFSSHSPNFLQTGIRTHWNMHEDRLNEYAAEINAAKSRWQGKLSVFLGLEVDYIKGLRSAMDSDIKGINPDFLIGSVHYVVPANGSAPFTVDGSQEEFDTGVNEGFGGSPEALMHFYYDTTLEMIAIGGFDILGHADIIKKNCIGKNLWCKESEEERQKEVAIAASKAGIIVEVNTGGITRGKINEVYPSLSFLRIFRQYNVPVIITADAHRADQINGNYNIALQTLISADFAEHIIFFNTINGIKTPEKEKIHL